MFTTVNFLNRRAQCITQSTRTLIHLFSEASGTRNSRNPAGCFLILSWNFKHIVNYDRIRKFNSVNLFFGYPQLDIRSPLEVIYVD